MKRRQAYRPEPPSGMDIIAALAVMAGYSLPAIVGVWLVFALLGLAS